MKFFSLKHVERAILGGPRDQENGTKPNVVLYSNTYVTSTIRAPTLNVASFVLRNLVEGF